jgi:hypothetical protein
VRGNPYGGGAAAARGAKPAEAGPGLAQQRFGNAKSISSSAFHGRDDRESDYEKQQRLQQFQVGAGACACTSASSWVRGCLVGFVCGASVLCVLMREPERLGDGKVDGLPETKAPATAPLATPPCSLPLPTLAAPSQTLTSLPPSPACRAPAPSPQTRTLGGRSGEAPRAAAAAPATWT